MVSLDEQIFRIVEEIGLDSLKNKEGSYLRYCDHFSYHLRIVQRRSWQNDSHNTFVFYQDQIVYIAQGATPPEGNREFFSGGWWGNLVDRWYGSIKIRSPSKGA